MLYQMMDCVEEELIDDQLDSPTDSDEYEMNADDCFEDPCDPYDMEYDF